jgi:hypothetical protein
MQGALEISVRGKPVRVTSLRTRGVDVIVSGRLLRTARIFDEYWLERETLPRPEDLIAELKAQRFPADVFVFTQRVPETGSRYAYRYDLDNVAVLPLSSYEHWFGKQIAPAARRNIRASEKRGIVVRCRDYDDEYVRGISAIYNEQPVRAGRKFWHYGKDLEAVRRENASYGARSTFLAAYLGGEMVGYLKLVRDVRTAAIMQILSKTSARDARVNNALMAEAVRQCCTHGIEYLLYERFDYGRKTGDSLTRFKQSNGFERCDVPRYVVALNLRGRLAIRLGLQRRLQDRIPESIAAPLRRLRSRWDEWRHDSARQRV